MANTNPDIDFQTIIPRNGSQEDSFEELCCLLASRESNDSFTRLYGSGGDGGIECYMHSAIGLSGWQAKYIFNVDRLIKKANDSLSMALGIHSNLTEFTLCFPFDPTGPTRRKGKCGVEKLDEWKKLRQDEAVEQGRTLIIEFWPKSKIIELILEHDRSGGIRQYFFGEIALTSEWFERHIENALSMAGPRYTPELNIKTPMHDWFVAFGREEDWVQEFESRIADLDDAMNDLRSTQALSGKTHELDLIWSGTSYRDTTNLIQNLDQLIGSLESPHYLSIGEFESEISNLDYVQMELGTIIGELEEGIDEQYESGSSRSRNWRQIMAEHAGGFPAAHLDCANVLLGEVSDILDWMNSESCFLAFKQAVILAGDPGSGKTHGICDVAKSRSAKGIYSCIVFGHQFNGNPDPWTRLAESLGLPVTFGRDRLMDCLNVVGEASGSPVVVFIDAINETEPSRYWNDIIASIIEEFENHAYLRLCLVCRSNMLDWCVPENINISVVTHRGFEGFSRVACESFFRHYELTPPIAPVLQAELSNPLYLRLVCKTLLDKGLGALPVDWSESGEKIIAAFLHEKSVRYRAVYEKAQPDASTKSLKKIAERVAEQGSSAITWDRAKTSISSIVMDPDTTLRWLVNEGLLIEDPPTQSDSDADYTLRLAFERLGDFLVASAIIETLDAENLDRECSYGGVLYARLCSKDAIASNRGLLSELSCLIPAKFRSFELTDLDATNANYIELAEIVIKALVYRETDTFTDSTKSIIRKVIADDRLQGSAYESVISSAWRKSCIDALWMHELLLEQRMVQRDLFWSPFLHKRYESNGVVGALIQSALDLSRGDLSGSVAERWVTTLLWFTAASDRRITDHATRAATTILRACPMVLPSVVERFLHIDDDGVRERVLLTCYGSLLESRDAQITSKIATYLSSEFENTRSNFDNALIRDHMRCICDLATRLRNDDDVDHRGDVFTKAKVSEVWPLELPSESDAERWGRFLRFDMLTFSDDFFMYTMSCLDPWRKGMSRRDMAKWITQHIVKGFGYNGEDSFGYEKSLLERYGGGRSKPVWAERLAKKYMWIGLYQLASKLNDHVERCDQLGNPDLQVNQLIFSSMRQLDPTVPIHTTTENQLSVDFPFSLERNHEVGREGDFDAWIDSKSVPEISELNRPRVFKGQSMQPIVYDHTWNGKEKDLGGRRAYRQMWFDLRSYLTTEKHLEEICDSLKGGNLFEVTFPDFGPFYEGFLGEYPWAIAFETGRYFEWLEDSLVHASLPLIPTWISVNCDYEYDATQTGESAFVLAPDIVPSDLVWDGCGNFITAEGSLLFVDPSIGSSELPRSLLVSEGYFDDLVTRDDVILVWSLKGQKLIVDSDAYKNGTTRSSLRFSQFGYRKGTSVFFDDMQFHSFG